MAISPSTRILAARPLVLGLAKLLTLACVNLPLISAAPTYVIHSEVDPKPPSDPSLWLYLGVAAALVLSGGAFAGLTIALMGQDEVYLQVIQTSGEEGERKNAASVLRLLQRGKHWVLVTLLLSNVITNETLPIVLDRSLGGGWPAVLGSTVLIVIFGEIVPQSICVRYGLPIGAWMAPCVLALMYIMSPVAYPVAKLLDKLLGEDHGTIYKKAGLKTLVTLHKTLGEAGEQLNSDEVTIISAVLDLKDKSVGSIMTPMEDVFTMSADTILDEETMDLILSQGYSRIPIHAPDNDMNFVGMLLVKMLITYDPEDCKRVRDFALATLPETRPETSCLDIVNFFQEGKSHMVLVSEYPGEDRGALGVVTLEDVIEELIGEEIIDESDVFVDVHKAIRRMAPAPKSRVPKGRIVEDPPMLPVESGGPLIDIEGESTAELPANGTLKENRRSSVEAPLPRFQFRRPHSDRNSDSTDGLVTQRGATDEIREHLKHLGPSNLASRPRHTRYQSVKIKRSASPSRSGHTDLESRQSADGLIRSTSSGLQGGLGAGLVQSGMDARDGVYAVRAGYGTLGHGRSLSDTARMTDGPALSIPEAVHEEQDDNTRPSTRAQQDNSPAHSFQSTDTELSDRLRPGSYRHKGPARSGSITEQVVDVNGIRKVVLHTTSTATSSSESDALNATALTQFPAQQNGEIVNLGSGDGSGSKKKRRRKRRGHGSKSGDLHAEDAPLLAPE